MRIAFIINALGRGGAERVFVDDANALAQAGHDVHMCLVYKDRAEHDLIGELDRGVSVVFLHANGPFDFGAIGALRRYMAERRIEAALSTLNDANIVARFASAFSSVRLYMREANDPQRKTTWQKILDFACFFVPKGIVVVTADIGRKVATSMPLLARKIHVLHNAAPEVRGRASSEDAEFCFVFVGRFDTQKDPLSLVQAFERVRKSIPCRMRMIGDGSLLPEAKRIAEDLGVASSIEFLGAVPHQAVIEAMKRSDALVLSSLWEGCPNAVLEAMALGMPVIATRVGGVPELVDERNGIIVAPQDVDAFAAAMAALAADRKRSRTLGAAAWERAKHEFSREEHMRKLLAILAPEK